MTGSLSPCQGDVTSSWSRGSSFSGRRGRSGTQFATLGSEGAKDRRLGSLTDSRVREMAHVAQEGSWQRWLSTAVAESISSLRELKALRVLSRQSSEFSEDRGSRKNLGRSRWILGLPKAATVVAIGLGELE
jgi:hypothetical protein